VCSSILISRLKLSASATEYLNLNLKIAVQPCLYEETARKCLLVFIFKTKLLSDYVLMVIVTVIVVATKSRKNHCPNCYLLKSVVEKFEGII